MPNIRITQRAGVLHSVWGSPPAVLRRLSVVATMTAQTCAYTVATAGATGILESLGRRPATVDDLAAELGIPRDRVRRVVDAALRFRIMKRRGDVVSLRAVGREILGPDRLVQTSMAVMIARAGGSAGLDHLLHDEPADPARHTYDVQRANADARAEFAAYMAGTAHIAAGAFADVWDPGDARRVLDVGGGIGILSGVLTERHPELCSTVVDLPEMAPLVESALAKAGSLRVAFHGADAMNEALPTGHDTAIFSRFLCDWNDDRAAQLLRRAADAVGPGGRIVIYELLRDGDLGNSLHVVIAAMEMMRYGLGDMRTPAQYRSLLERVGLREIEISAPIDTTTKHSIITAVVA